MPYKRKLDTFNTLVDIIARLRAPNGCPWDKQQTHLSLKPNLVEECYEALEAIDQAIAMKKAIYGTEDHPCVAEALEVQAKIYDHRCEFDKEQAVWERVLEIQHRSYSDQHPALATTHYDYEDFRCHKIKENKMKVVYIRKNAVYIDDVE